MRQREKAGHDSVVHVCVHVAWHACIRRDQVYGIRRGDVTIMLL